jgi:hypothetical protein
VWFSQLTEDQLSFDAAVIVLYYYALAEADAMFRGGSKESRGYSVRSANRTDIKREKKVVVLMELHRAIIYTTKMSKQVTKSHVRIEFTVYLVNSGARLLQGSPLLSYSTHIYSFPPL